MDGPCGRRFSWRPAFTDEPGRVTRLGLYFDRVWYPGSADAFGGVMLSADHRPVLQWVYRVTEVAGAASFFAGLGSVSFFGKRDRIPPWHVD